MIDNYPPGAVNDPNAPYNQRDPEPIEIEVTISMTLSKTVKIYVDDYTQDGSDIDFSECNLSQAVDDQITLPNEEVEGWNVDDFEVVLE